jgi:hypothetical protein
LRGAQMFHHASQSRPTLPLQSSFSSACQASARACHVQWGTCVHAWAEVGLCAGERALVARAMHTLEQWRPPNAACAGAVVQVLVCQPQLKGPSLYTHTHTHTLHAWMDDMRRVSADDEILHCEQQGFEWRVGVVRTPGGRERQRRRRQSQRRQRPGPSSRTTSSQQSALSSRTPGTASSASSSAEAPSASRRCSALDTKCVVLVGRQNEQPHTRGATSNKRVHE